MKGERIRKPSNGVAVVFLHGVLSDRDCWLHESGGFRPEILASDARVSEIVVYVLEYNAGLFSGTYRLSDAVDALREQLETDEVDQYPTLVFVCHSMGGIVARRYVVQNQLELVTAKKTVGLFMIASPSLGSEYANWTCNSFVPITYLIKPPWLQWRAG